MKKSPKETRFSWEHIKDFCETLTEAQDALTREMVSRISDKWSLWTMSVIAELGQPMRFSRIMDQVEGISQKSLTKTLRGLERDGLITREVFAEVRPGLNTRSRPLAPRCSTTSRPFGSGWESASSAFRTAEPRSIVANSGPGRTAEVAGRAHEGSASAD